MGTPKDWTGQDTGVRGDLVVVSDGVSNGDIRTRVSGVNTGGGSVITRHLYFGGSAGGVHGLDSTGTEYWNIMPDASPAPANYIVSMYVGGSLQEAMRWTNDGTTTIASLIAAIDGGVTFGDGRSNSGLILPVGAEARSICNEDFTPLGWRLITDKAGACSVQVLRQAYSSYDNATWIDVTGTTISPTGMPAMASGLKATGSNLGGWASTADWSRGDAIRALVNTNGAGIGWYSLQIYGRRNVKKT